MRARDTSAAIVVVTVAALSVATAWAGPIVWTPDGYFYEAQVRELRGAGRTEALASVFEGRLTATRRATERAELPLRDRRVANPAWVRYSARFYRRRWTVPLAAAAVYPLFGTRSLEVVSLLGYLAAAAGLYALARLRFSPLPSAIAAVAVSLLPQYRAAALSPLTDTWGVALEALSLILAVRFCRTGRRALAIGTTLAMLALAFTRDNAVVVALALLAAGFWSRRALFLGGIGAAAAAVPSLCFGTHYPVLLAYTLAHSHIPPSTSLSWSADHYGGGLRTMLHGLDSPRRLGVPPLTGVGLSVGLAALVVLRRGGIAWTVLVASAAASIVFMLALPQEGYRIALVLLPAAAFGYAALVAWMLQLRGARTTL